MSHHEETASHQMLSPNSTYALARGLGWLSIGLGLTQLLAPKRVAASIGMEQHTSLIQAYGVREIATGIGILTQRDPTGWIWGRVAGDALDLATLSSAVPDNPRKGSVLLAMMAVAGVTLFDVICVRELGGTNAQPSRRPVRDYSNRVGLQQSPGEMRGTARDFVIPKDFRIPELLRPWKEGSITAGARSSPAAGGTSGRPIGSRLDQDQKGSNLKPQLSSTQTVRAARQTAT